MSKIHYCNPGNRCLVCSAEKNCRRIVRSDGTLHLCFYLDEWNTPGDFKFIGKTKGATDQQFSIMVAAADYRGSKRDDRAKPVPPEFRPYFAGRNVSVADDDSTAAHKRHPSDPLANYNPKSIRLFNQCQAERVPLESAEWFIIDYYSRQLGLPWRAFDASRYPLFHFVHPLYGAVLAYDTIDGDGRVTGVKFRTSAGNKYSCCHPSLVYNDAALAQAEETGEPVPCVEGMTDFLAAGETGIPSVARDSNTGGVAHLYRLLQRRPRLNLIICGENDKKDDGTQPGRTGAEHVARELARLTGRSFPIAFPAPPAKDMRQAYGCELSKQLPAEVYWIDSPDMAYTLPDVGLARRSIITDLLASRELITAPSPTYTPLPEGVPMSEIGRIVFGGRAAREAADLVRDVMTAAATDQGDDPSAAEQLAAGRNRLYQHRDQCRCPNARGIQLLREATVPQKIREALPFLDDATIFDCLPFLKTDHQMLSLWVPCRRLDCDVCRGQKQEMWIAAVQTHLQRFADDHPNETLYATMVNEGREMQRMLSKMRSRRGASAGERANYFRVATQIPGRWLFISTRPPPRSIPSEPIAPLAATEKLTEAIRTVPVYGGGKRVFHHSDGWPVYSPKKKVPRGYKRMGELHASEEMVESINQQRNLNYKRVRSSERWFPHWGIATTVPFNLPPSHIYAEYGDGLMPLGKVRSSGMTKPEPKPGDREPDFVVTI